MHAAASLFPNLLASLEVGPEVGQILKLVCKHAAFGIGCSLPGNIDKVVRVGDGDRPLLLDRCPKNLKGNLLSRSSSICNHQAAVRTGAYLCEP